MGGDSQVDSQGSHTLPRCVAALQSNGTVVHRTVSSSQDYDPTYQSGLQQPTVPVSVSTHVPTTKSVTVSCTNTNGVGSVKHVIHENGSALPSIHEPKERSKVNCVVDRKYLNGSLTGTVIGSLPDLGTISKESTLVGVKLRSGSFTSCGSRIGTNVLKSTNLEGVIDPYGNNEYYLGTEDTTSEPTQFVGSTFGGPHACLVSQRLLGYNSLTRPSRNFVGSSSPPLSLIPLSSISSSSSSAVSLSEISEEGVVQSSNEISISHDDTDAGTSFCTAINTSTTSSVCFLTTSSFNDDQVQCISSQVFLRRPLSDSPAQWYVY